MEADLLLEEERHLEVEMMEADLLLLGVLLDGTVALVYFPVEARQRVAEVAAAAAGDDEEEAAAGNASVNVHPESRHLETEPPCPYRGGGLDLPAVG